LPYCPNCGSTVESTDRFCRVCGRAFAAAQAPVVTVVERKSSAGKIVAAVFILILIFFGFMFVFPLFRANIPYSPSPSIPIVTYTVEIRTLSGTKHTRYNVVSYHIEKGTVPFTYTVTLHYLGGSSETFNWVVEYSIRRN